MNLAKLLGLGGKATRSLPATRSLEGAGGGRRWASDPAFGTLSSEWLLGGATTRRRALHFHRNNPHARRASDVLAANIIGSGLKPQSEHPDPQIRDQIDAVWVAWAGGCDSTARTDFSALQALAVRSVIEQGEAFIYLRAAGTAGLLQLQILQPSQVDETLNRDIGDGNRILAGIEIDATDKPIAYHIFPSAPGEPFGRPTLPIRVLAEDIIHTFEPLQPGQVRGLPWLTPVLTRLRDLDAFEDAEIERQKVSAMLMGFVRDLQGTAGDLFDGEAIGSSLLAGLEPGTIKILPSGTDITFSDPKGNDQYEQFVPQQLRAIATAMGMTFEQISGDMRGVNYSSARVALIEFRKRIEAVQSLFIHQFCEKVWTRFLEMAVLSGALPQDAVGSPVAWIRPAWAWIDPLKDIQAERMAVASGFKSRRKVISERGEDPDRVLQEIAEERAAAEALGVVFEGEGDGIATTES